MYAELQFLTYITVAPAEEKQIINFFDTFVINKISPSVFAEQRGSYLRTLFYRAVCILFHIYTYNCQFCFHNKPHNHSIRY